MIQTAHIAAGMRAHRGKRMERFMPAGVAMQACRLLMLLAIAALTLVPAGCNVHEWPEEPGGVTPTPKPDPEPEPEDVPVTLNLVFDAALPLHKEITYSRYGEPDHDIRYMVQIFSGSRSKDGNVMRTLTFSRPYDATDLDFSTQLTLDDGDYEFYAWADLVTPGSTGDKYYDTTSWDKLLLRNRTSHEGSNERRDAFRGTLKKTVVNSPSVTVSNTVTIPMGRPLARFEFIATDIDEFVSRARNRAGESSTESSDSRATEVNLNDYTVVFQYSGFMPSGYNIYTDKANDAWANVQFTSKMNATDGGVSMGFDYVFTDSETSVTMLMGVYDNNGNAVASTKQVEVPLARSKNTIVKGEFLSEQASGGVAINPGFDGEYNIELK